jgi:hypothetical protein
MSSADKLFSALGERSYFGGIDIREQTGHKLRTIGLQSR